jgi:hypothetical protein
MDRTTAALGELGDLVGDHVDFTNHVTATAGLCRAIGYSGNAAIPTARRAATAHDQVGCAEAEVLAELLAKDRTRLHGDGRSTSSFARDRTRERRRMFAAGKTDQRALAGELHDDIDASRCREDLFGRQGGDMSTDDDHPGIPAFAKQSSEGEGGERRFGRLQRHTADPRSCAQDIAHHLLDGREAAKWNHAVLESRRAERSAQRGHGMVFEFGRDDGDQRNVHGRTIRVCQAGIP